MTITNEQIMKCMSDLFVLWRAGKIMSAEAIGHAQYVVGGYLVLTSGHADGPRMLSSGMLSPGDQLKLTVAADAALVNSMKEFSIKQSPRGATGDFFDPFDFFINALVEMILKWMKGDKA